jgi:hypothetical protein
MLPSRGALDLNQVGGRASANTKRLLSVGGILMKILFFAPSMYIEALCGEAYVRALIAPEKRGLHA